MCRMLSLPDRRSASVTGVLPHTSAAPTSAPLLSSSCTACRPRPLFRDCVSRDLLADPRRPVGDAGICGLWA